MLAGENMTFTDVAAFGLIAIAFFVLLIVIVFTIKKFRNNNS